MRNEMTRRIKRLPWWSRGLLIVAGVTGIVGASYATLQIYSQRQTNSSPYIRRWFDSPDTRESQANYRANTCDEAPFMLPSDGLIGLLWRDPAGPYNVLHRHTGLDIFGDGSPGEVSVFAAYEGWLTRLPDWKSSVIIRHDDPLQPGRTIWTYYTHMASKDGETSYIDAAFPPGTSEVWVAQGTRLGAQGIYSGNSVIPVGLHVHFSMVTSEPDGTFKNEADLNNTLDPSPYLGMNLRAEDRPDRPIRCME